MATKEEIKKLWEDIKEKDQQAYREQEECRLRAIRDRERQEK